QSDRAARCPHASPTRRSSDLSAGPSAQTTGGERTQRPGPRDRTVGVPGPDAGEDETGHDRTYRVDRLVAELPFGVVHDVLAHGQDRKSTRLNSSHVSNSYAVF